MSTYDVLHARAREVLSGDVYDYIATGSGVEETLVANEAAWRVRSLLPRVLRDVSNIDTSVSLLGTEIAAPIGVAPVGFQRLTHTSGEVATATGARDAGSLFVLSTRSTSPFEDVVRAVGPWWFQVYILRDRELTKSLVQKAVEGAATALVLTADTPVVGTKARPGNALAGASTALIPELVTREDEGTWQAADVTFDDIEWLREISGGLPVVVKGVLTGDDAKECADSGASAIWVSNHGGRQLDAAVPTAHALPDVANAVSADVEVYVDGGIRNGRDIVRALALGARAVFLGRPISWALATGGAEGVRDFLLALRGDLAETLALAGCRNPAEVTRDLLAP